MNYIKIPKKKTNPLSWELLAKRRNMTLEEYKKWYKDNFGMFNFDCRPKAEGCKCPYKIRDLENDTCYQGKKMKCKHFVKYDFDNQGNTFIVCKCKERYIEGSLF